MKNVVIADDFSGAAELAGVAYQTGLTCEVQLDTLSGGSADVIVLDANSRSLETSQAASVMHRMAGEVWNWFNDDRIADGWVYRKVDSVLRGPLASELEALRRAYEAPRVVLVNANPRKHRFVRDKCLWVNGQPIHETSFAHDPEYPRTTMRIADLLDWPADDLHFWNADQALPESGLCVANVATSQEMLKIAQGVKRALVASGELQISSNTLRNSHKTVLAGAAEFYEAILSEWFGLRIESDVNHRLQPGEHVLLVSGTSVPAALETNDMQVLRAQASTPDHGNLNDFKSGRSRALRMHQQFIVRAVDELSLRQYEQLWIEGGRTASTLLRCMGWTRLNVEAVYADGVVGLRSVAGNSPHVVVKPGSYPWYPAKPPDEIYDEIPAKES